MTVDRDDVLDALYRRRGYLRLRQAAIGRELEEIECTIDELSNPRPVGVLIAAWKEDIAAKRVAR